MLSRSGWIMCMAIQNRQWFSKIGPTKCDHMAKCFFNCKYLMKQWDIGQFSPNFVKKTTTTKQFLNGSSKCCFINLYFSTSFALYGLSRNTMMPEVPMAVQEVPQLLLFAFPKILGVFVNYLAKNVKFQVQVQVLFNVICIRWYMRWNKIMFSRSQLHPKLAQI